MTYPHLLSSISSLGPNGQSNVTQGNPCRMASKRTSEKPSNRVRTQMELDAYS